LARFHDCWSIIISTASTPCVKGGELSFKSTSLKKQFYQVLLLCIFSTSIAFCQESGQLAYVATENGLRIRNEPNLTSAIVGTLNFNDSIPYLPTQKLDTIDNRVSNWIKVNLPDSGEIGYVFGGYLNKYKLPEKEYGLFNDYIPHFIKKFELSRHKEYSAHLGGAKGFEQVSISEGERLTIISYTSFEYARTEYYISDISINDFVNLFDLMKDYYGDESFVMKGNHDKYSFKRFWYGVPDAGMGENEILQMDSNVVRIKFVWSL